MAYRICGDMTPITCLIPAKILQVPPFESSLVATMKCIGDLHSVLVDNDRAVVLFSNSYSVSVLSREAGMDHMVWRSIPCSKFP